MGSSEVAIATPGSGWGLGKKGREGVPDNTNKISQRSTLGPCHGPRPLPCPSLASLATLLKITPEPLLPYPACLPSTHTHHKPSPSSVTQIPSITSFVSHSPLPLYTRSCFCHPLNLQKWLQDLTPAPLFVITPYQVSHGPILRCYP